MSLTLLHSNLQSHQLNEWLAGQPMIDFTIDLCSWEVQRGGLQMEVNDHISIKSANYIKSTLLSFLKVCLYGCYTNLPFYPISPFHQLNIVSHKVCENHF